MATPTEKRHWKENFKKFLLFENIFDQKCRTDVNVVLDQLNAEEYTANLVPEQKDILAFFNKGCSLISVEKNNNFLLSKFFQLVEKILLKQKVVLDANTLNNLVEHIIKSANICPSISVYDHLQVLAELLYENGSKCSKYNEDLLGAKPVGLLLKFSDCKADIESQKLAITCIGNICIKDLNGSYINEHYGEISLLTVLNVLQTPPRKNVIKIDHCKLINTSLKAIQDILPCVKSPLKRHLGQILLTIKNYLFYGFPGYELSFPNRGPSDVSPRDSSSDLEPDDLGALKLPLTPVKERTFPGRGALKKKKSRQRRGKRTKDDNDDDKIDEDIGCRSDISHRKTSPASDPGQASQRNKNGGDNEITNASMATNTVISWRERANLGNVAWSSCNSSSESEFSDSESGQARRLRAATAKVRNWSLVCLQIVIKNSNKKDLFGFWSSFISDGSGALMWSLFSIIQNDPDFKNRTGATSVLMDLLDGSKQFLSAADDSDRHQASSARPFTSFSSRLGSIIYELHRLLDVIPTERSISTQVQLIKCMAVLILNCPYHKLQPGLLTKVHETIRPLLSQEDFTIKQSCLVCLGALLTVDAPLNEVISIMENKITINDCETATHCQHTPDEDFKHVPQSLVHECLNILRCSNSVSQVDDTKDLVTHLRSEVLHLLIVFARNYFNLLRPLLLNLTDVTHECLKEPNPTIQVNCIKLFQELGRMMHETMYNDDEEAEKIIIKQFWQRLLNGELVKILQSDDISSKKCKAAACDCLSDIGGNVYEDLPFDKRVLVITMLLGLTNDDDTYVKAASIRGLGVYVLYPLLRGDVVFVTDTANVFLDGLKNTVLLVRMRSAWSLANLSDALVINKNSKLSTFKDHFSETLFLRLVNESVKTSEDHEKVKCNIVRSLGNFAKYFSQSNIKDQRFSEAFASIVAVLTKCILTGLMKTRWNACYAAGNVFSNHDMATERTLLLMPMFDALLSVVSTCKNFKVRINAVNALAVPTTREYYGDEKQFVKVWSCLIDTLIVTKTISDFSEFKYRDTLREQISATICHLANLTTIDDMHFLQVIISDNQEDLSQYLAIYYQNKLKRDNHSQKQITDQSTTLFLHACEYILTMKDDAFRPIQCVFNKAKKTAEDYIQSMFKPPEKNTP